MGDEHNMNEKRPGRFIVLEGLDGAGTTTQAQELVAFIRGMGWPVIFTSEPSIGPMGYVIRLMLSKRLISEQHSQIQETLSNDSTALLFAADRLDHLQHTIIPRLAEGFFVVCDRYYLSSYAYQLNADRSNYEWLRTINSRCRRPDLTLFLRTSPSICEVRRSKDRWHKELYEESHILERVAENYEYVVTERQAAGERIETLEGDASQQRVREKILGTVKRAFADLFIDQYPLIQEIL